MTVTIKDIAKSAGVSYSTVSKALRNSSLVKQPTKEKIRAIALELGYEPNLAAQVLVSRKTFTIGVVWPSVDREMQAALITLLNNQLEEEGYTTLISINDISRSVKAFQRLQVDAMLIFDDQQHQDTLPKTTIPTVLFGLKERSQFPVIDVNRHEAVKKITEYVIEEGALSILYAGLTEGEDPLQAAKFEGFLAATSSLQGATAVYNTKGLNRLDGYKAMKAILQLGSPPHAIIFGSYDLTVGAIDAIHELNITKTNHLRIASYDNMSGHHELTFPVLFTGVPLTIIVETLVDKLLQAADGQPVTSISLDPVIHPSDIL
ncbi:LacI family DNA-binding transcriptional regulator [Paenalkalicoccus suaedae]|uniref:LacI family DNA-binding transcriptional regulator n=1 Tax=Paenalkalicoccus suaedae TaxID=2592382 RepID=A0A859FBX7_9BACI|nr:LacI family DNA-binding transcriptional regulator [Paenalkalicoccus suaedae]QKS69736.1 LacI family DNA-binding transcriptional regulator [Paenalkalicoccus suaedae]